MLYASLLQNLKCLILPSMQNKDSGESMGSTGSSPVPKWDESRSASGDGTSATSASTSGMATHNKPQTQPQPLAPRESSYSAILLGTDKQVGHRIIYSIYLFSSELFLASWFNCTSRYRDSDHSNNSHCFWSPCNCIYLWYLSCFFHFVMSSGNVWKLFTLLFFTSYQLSKPSLDETVFTMFRCRKPKSHPSSRFHQRWKRLKSP